MTRPKSRFKPSPKSAASTPSKRKPVPKGKKGVDQSSLPGIRVNRFFTENGLISRREADRAIEEGRVKINGKTAHLGARVMPQDKVALDGRILQVGKKDPVILAFHKPAGVECTSDAGVENNIIDAVNYHERIFHIGRLDKMSEGLILLTNLGDIVNKVLRARYFHEKEYLVSVNRPITDYHIETLSKGVELEDGMTRPCKVTRVDSKTVNMVLTEGRNRQIRRMMETLGLEVLVLRRVRIMDVRLGSLGYGHWRKFTPAEMTAFMKSLD